MTRDDHDLYDDNDGYDGENCRSGHSEEERDNDDESGKKKTSLTAGKHMPIILTPFFVQLKITSSFVYK